eukprot:jgi/Mesvir1/3380/Mv05085-RA.1
MECRIAMARMAPPSVGPLQSSFTPSNVCRLHRRASPLVAPRQSLPVVVADGSGKLKKSELLAKLQAENEALRKRIQELEKEKKASPVAAQVQEPAVAVAAAALATGEDVKSSKSGKKKKAAALVAAEAAVEDKPSTALKLDLKWPSPSDAEPFWKRNVPPEALAGTDAIPPGTKDPHPKYIVHVTAEMAPIAKVGGLGDVITGLSRACLSRGHYVEVILPFYECMPKSQIAELKQQDNINSYHRNGWIDVQVFTGKIAGVPVVLLKPCNNFFSGNRIYGGNYNELEAYLFFARASLELIVRTNRHPDVIHTHEWHTAVIGMLYWDMYRNLGLTKPRIMLTIHNMEHYGECRQDEFGIIGLDGAHYMTEDRAMDSRTKGHNPERGSLLKGGIVYSNFVTTVSPTYAVETKTNGSFLSSVLNTHAVKYFGVLNGIDVTLWDPTTDATIPANFSADDLSNKKVCKVFVQKGLGLKPDSLPGETPKVRTPLIACITRLVPQKGIHLIRHAIFRTLELGGQFILVGSSPGTAAHREFEKLAEEFKGSDKVKLMLLYSEQLAHSVYAAADALLVPSMFEPCGLTQMIAMRYGAIPIVRKTGGLADTVFDVDDESRKGFGNGFVFGGIDPASENSALDRMIKYYNEKPEWWEALTSSAMRVDNSWDRCANSYLDLYNRIGNL